MKKTFRAVLALVLAAAMLLGCSSVALAADDFTKKSDIQLQFNENGKFRILQLADTQDDFATAPGTILFMQKALAKYKPDLVVFTGDNTGNIWGKANVKLALKAILTICEEAKVPFTLVFGNHDAEKVSKEFHMSCYRSYSYCLTYNADPSIHGMANHNLTVRSSDGQRDAFNLWMFDSNMYDEVNGGYDHVYQDQIDWYVKTSNELKAANGGKVVPSLCFQHIVPNEIFDYIVETDADVADGYYSDSKHMILDPAHAEPGSVMYECPCPGKIDSLQVETFAQQGDVAGVVVGHDHINDYVVHTDYTTAAGTSLDIIQTPGAGFESYGDDRVRGCRIIDIDENDPWNYETSTPTFFDVVGDTEAMHKLSYFSDNSAFWYIAKVIEVIPYVGTLLSQLFLNAVYKIATK